MPGMDRAKTVSPSWHAQHPIRDRKRNSQVISRRTDALIERTGSPADAIPAREERRDSVAVSADRSVVAAGVLGAAAVSPHEAHLVQYLRWFADRGAGQ